MKMPHVFMATRERLVWEDACNTVAAETSAALAGRSVDRSQLLGK